MTNGNSPKIASEIIDAILAYGDARADKDLVKGTASLKKSIELIRSALSVCADGGKGEAVAKPIGYGKKTQLDAIDQNGSALLYSVACPDEDWDVPVYLAAPQAECAPRDSTLEDAAKFFDDSGDPEGAAMIRRLKHPPIAPHADADTAGAIDELKPCPFCGRDAEHIHVFAGEEIVRCVNEGCPVRPGVIRGDGQEAYGLWNQRAAGASNERADAEKDAARYRWLRDNCFDSTEPGDGDAFWHTELHFESDELECFDTASLDNAIDAAILAANK